MNERYSKVMDNNYNILGYFLVDISDNDIILYNNSDNYKYSALNSYKLIDDFSIIQRIIIDFDNDGCDVNSFNIEYQEMSAKYCKGTGSNQQIILKRVK